MKIDELIEEYKVLSDAMEAQVKLMDDDLDLLSMRRNIKATEDDLVKRKRELGEKEAEYLTKVTLAQDRLEEIKTEIAGKWSTWKIEGKTHNSGVGTAKLRVTHSLIVESKQKIIDALVKTDKLVEGISTFNLSYLKKLKAVNLIPDDAARLEPKNSVSIKLVGDVKNE